MVRRTVSFTIQRVPIDPNSLPHDPEILKQMLVDLTRQLDKTQRLLQQLVTAKSGTRSEQLSADQLRLFAQELGIDLPPAAEADRPNDSDDNPSSPTGSAGGESKPRGRRRLPSHLKRERIVHDLAEAEKHCLSAAAASRDKRHDGMDHGAATVLTATDGDRLGLAHH